MAVAGTLVAMFASVSAHRYGFEFWGIRTRNLIDTQTRMLHWAVTGREAPAADLPASREATRPRTGPVLGGATARRRSGGVAGPN
jgi:hypothetical protein